MPSKASENVKSFSSIYKTKGDREAQSSRSFRRRSVRNEQKLKKDEQMDQRRGLLGMSALSELDNTLESDTETEMSNGKMPTSGSKRNMKSGNKALTADSRALSLKERLQKWKEEKKKQAEQKRKQPPAFVVKNVEYRSDPGLYSNGSTNVKKLPKPEINFNFAQTAKIKKIYPNQHNVKSPPKQDVGLVSKRNQHLKKTNDAEAKQRTQTTTTRVTRQAEKMKNSKGKAVLQTKQDMKNLKDVHSSAQEIKLKFRPVKDLHLRLTASAAAKKQENADKPKDFLRAKPHHFAIGRTTRSQTKQVKPEDESLSTGSKHQPSSQLKKLSKKRKTSTCESDSKMEVSNSRILEMSPQKSYQLEKAKAIWEDKNSEKSSISGDTTVSDDQSGKEEFGSRKQLRRSTRYAKKEPSLDKHLDNVEEFHASNTENRKSIVIQSDLQQENEIGLSNMSVNLDDSQNICKGTPGRKSKRHVPTFELGAISLQNKSLRKSLRSSMVPKTFSGSDEETGANCKEPIHPTVELPLKSGAKEASLDEHLENVEEFHDTDNRKSIVIQSDLEQENEIGPSNVGVDLDDSQNISKGTPGRKSKCYVPPFELSANPLQNKMRKSLRLSMVSQNLSDYDNETDASGKEPIHPIVELPFKSGAKDSLVSAGLEEQIVVQIEATATPNKKSRWSKISSLNVITPRRSVRKAFLQSEKDSSNVGDGYYLCDDNGKSNHETEKSASEDVKWVGAIKANSSKRTRKSIDATVLEAKREDQVQGNENLFSPKRAKLAIKTETSLDEEDITNLAVTFTPGKNTRRSVVKVFSSNETDAEGSGTYDEKSTNLIDPVQKPPSGVGSRKSDTLFSVSGHSEEKMSANHTKQTPRRKSENVMSVSAGSSVPQASLESYPSSNRRAIVITPLRKSRRSVITPMATNNLSSGNVNLGSSLKAPYLKLTPRNKSKSLLENNTEQAIENTSGEQGEADVDIADTQMSLDYNHAPDEPIQNKVRYPDRQVQNSANSKVGIKSNKRRYSRKTPKSARRPSCSRTRGSTNPGSFSPLSRRWKSTSTIISVSEEGTSNLKGKAVVEQAVTPNSSFAENKLPVNESERRKSGRRSTARGVTGEEDISDPVYRLAKSSLIEAETGPLQEITVEKVEGETSYIEVPLDESEISLKTTSPASTPTQILKDSSLNGKAAEEPMTQGNSSTETEPFTPRKSCNVTKASQDSIPSIEATPDLPPRVPVRQFKTPFQAPQLAHRAMSSSTRLRSKTVHHTPSRSPEEMIKILASSPMIEMTRRRSRHVSSPASVLPMNFNFNANTASPGAGSPSLQSCVVEKVPETIQSLAHDEKEVATNDNVETLEPKKILQELTSETTPQSDPQVMKRVLHFRNILVVETKRLNELCKIWEEIAAYTFGITDEILGQIRTTVGKAKLLIDQRFKQFSGLVDNCEFNLGEQKTRPEDLQGFWEMIYFQVEDVNGLFQQLKVLQDNNWEKQKSPLKILKKKKIGATGSKPKGVSNFKAFHREMMLRKAQKTAAATGATKDSAVATVAGEEQQDSLEFDGIFFKVTSPARTAKGKRATLGSQTNSPKAESPVLDDANPIEATLDKSNELPIPNSSTPVAANKENESITPVRHDAQGSHQIKLGMTAKRLSYVPVIPSPLLKDTTGITSKHK